MSQFHTWAKAQIGVSANAKNVLNCVADYAQMNGRFWCLVSIIEVETGLKERTVQRALEELKVAGLIEPTGDFETVRQKRVPIYRLPYERGPKTTAETIKLLQAEAGVSLVTPEEGASVTGDTPTGVTHDTPTGVTGDTQRENSNPNPKTHRARVCASGLDEGGEAVDLAFETVAAAWVQVAPERFSRPLAAGAWRATVRTVDRDALCRAALAYLAAPKGEVSRGCCKSLHKWLSARAFEIWLPGALFKAATAPAKCFPDPVIRAAVVEAAGETWVLAYLDPADWDDASRTIRPRTGVASQKLGDRCDLWRRLNVRIGAVADRQSTVSKTAAVGA